MIGHLHEMYQQPFQMQPDYLSERVVFLGPKASETYVPVTTLARYGWFNTPKPFILILLWVKTVHGWKMATDLPIPVPSPTLATKTAP